MRRRRLARLASLDTPPVNNVPREISPPANDHDMKVHSGDPPGSSNMSLPPNIAPAVAPCRPQNVSRSSPEYAGAMTLGGKAAPMEVEDGSCEKQFNSGVDVDSGIENMEVEDLDRKDITPRSRVSVNL